MAEFSAATSAATSAAPYPDDPSPTCLVTGSTGYVGGKLLRLRAQMRLPGLAWPEFHVEHGDRWPGTTRLRQRVTSHPRGLLGHLNGWSVAPFHGVVSGGVLRDLVRAAERQPASPATPHPIG